MKIVARGTLALAAAMAVLLPAGITQAQITESLTEFGIDAGFAFGLGDENTVSIGLPASVRVGFFTSPSLSIEPYGGLTYEDTGESDATTINIGTGLLYHFLPPRTSSTLYLRPFVDLLYVSGVEDDTRVGIGAGIGYKSSWRERFGTRLEVNFGYRSNPGESLLGALAGLSFYTN